MTEPTIEVLISRQALGERLDELAAEIDAQHRETEVLTCIGVLKGSLYFLADLTRLLSTPVEIDFVQVSSYRGTVRGRLEVKRRPHLDLRERSVLLVEDIVDSGYSVATVLDVLAEHGARRVEVCTLLDKTPAREIEVPIKYRGFEVGNDFVVGYGLDLDERYRNLPHIGVVTQEA